MALASNAADWPDQGLDEAMVAPEPGEQFGRWMADAVAFGMPEPTAGEVVKEARMEGDRFRVTIVWPKTSVRILAIKEEGAGGRRISPAVWTAKFFTAKLDYLGTH